MGFGCLKTKKKCIDFYAQFYYGRTHARPVSIDRRFHNSSALNWFAIKYIKKVSQEFRFVPRITYDDDISYGKSLVRVVREYVRLKKKIGNHRTVYPRFQSDFNQVHIIKRTLRAWVRAYVCMCVCACICLRTLYVTTDWLSILRAYRLNNDSYE